MTTTARPVAGKPSSSPECVPELDRGRHRGARRSHRPGPLESRGHRAQRCASRPACSASAPGPCSGPWKPGAQGPRSAGPPEHVSASSCAMLAADQAASKRATSRSAGVTRRTPACRPAASSAGHPCAAGCGRRRARARPPRTAWREDRVCHGDGIGRRARSRSRTGPRPSRGCGSSTAASEAVPTPASRITGTPAASTISVRLAGLAIPWPLPIGEPSGMTAAQVAASRRRARTGSSLV